MEESKRYEGSFKYRRWLAILIVIGSTAGLIISFVQFSIGYIAQDLLFRQLIYSGVGFLVAIFIYKIPEPKPNFNRAKLITTIMVVFGTATIGIPITFFTTGFLLRAILGGPIPAGPLGDAFLIFSFIVAPFIWGFIGYFIAKTYIRRTFPE
jgi:hypothetical protein